MASKISFFSGLSFRIKYQNNKVDANQRNHNKVAIISHILDIINNDINSQKVHAIEAENLYL